MFILFCIFVLSKINFITMIIAIPSSSDNLEANIDDRFGRCPWFCFYNTITGESCFKRNDIKNDVSGVGPQVVEFLANNKVKEIYAKEVGPKAAYILEKLEIKVNPVAGSYSRITQIIQMLNSKTK